MCIYDYDPAEVWREENRRARKPHRCDECGRTIDAGEPYGHITTLYEGYWSTTRVCEQCRAATRWLTDVCHGYLLEDVLHELSDHLDEPAPISSPALARLVVRMRHRWERHDGRRWTRQEIEALVELAAAPARGHAA